MHTQLIEKPLILAICGKSAAGKDTLAYFLSNYLSSLGFHTHNMVSITTRPKRANETKDVDYYFVTEDAFQDLIKKRVMIEHAKFRGWYYGIPYNEVKRGCINIGVFNLEGLVSLQKAKYDYTIIPIYINEKLGIRLQRSHDREDKWKIEYFRRAIADWWTFRHIQQYLNKFHGRYIYLDKVNGVWRQSKYITRYLEKFKIFIYDNEQQQLQLGNFI